MKIYLRFKSIFNNFFENLWQEAYRFNDHNILSLLDKNRETLAIDIGCGDGQKTAVFKEKLNCKKIVGIDGVSQRLEAAKQHGVDKTIEANLETKWPILDSSFDVVISNQVIEHIYGLDNFISEIERILKPGGYCVISTENLASWHNIFALVLGYQDFSHHIIKKTHVGNPLSPHNNQKTASWSKEDNSGVDDTAFPHVKILTYRSLIKSFEAYGLRFVSGKGAGYYPLFSIFSKLMSRLDPYHSHFITVKFKKTKSL